MVKPSQCCCDWTGPAGPTVTRLNKQSCTCRKPELVSSRFGPWKIQSNRFPKKKTGLLTIILPSPSSLSRRRHLTLSQLVLLIALEDMTSSASSPNTIQLVIPTTQSVRAKSDPTWDHCQLVQDVDGKKSIKCLYCSKCYKGGGIHRIKQHLAGEKGDVLPCLSVPFEVKHQLKEHLNQVSGSRKRGTNQIRSEEDADEENMNPPIIAKGKGKTNTLDFAPRTMPGAQPSIKMGFAGKDAIHKADLAIARFFYDCCIPFNCSNSVYYQPMINAIAAIGHGYKGPTYYAIRSNLLHEMKKEVELLVENFRSFWKETGCTIMADGWQDQRNRQLINFLVYSPKGISFVRSVDASDVVKDARTLCNLFIELVEFVGVTNVVHLVTDNAANYKAAGAMLNEKFPSIFWSPCAAHCLNLILGDIGKMEHEKTRWKEIIRLGATRFATTFIALQSIHEHKHDLQALVASKDFIDSRYYRDKKANRFVEVVMNTRFWNDCAIIVNIVAPLIRLLRIVDADERPSLPYVYDGMCRERKTIKNVFMNKKSLYKPYTRIIKQRWDKQLRTKLHCAAYFLNPTFYYDKENFCIKPEVQQGWLDVLQAKVTTSKTNFFKQSCIYHDKVGSFGNSMAIEIVKHLRPNQWWSQFGFSAPMVSQLAIKILSQTTSSTGCERNWSVFERIHTRKRNKLEHKRLNDLVYVHYNLGLKDREVNKKRTLDPVDYESMENIEFWITEEEEEETPLIDYDEIEKMFYYDLSNPILDLTKDDEGMVEGQNITIDGGLNLDSFPQEDVDSYTQSTSLTNNVNLGSNQDNDTWMN
ncbi:hypothetical protein Lal_00041706 [Lupinus albus]|nr:hypothetical protein Lal_00041706 [Lupinus albus]